MAVTLKYTVPSQTTSTNLGALITPISFASNCFSSLYDFQTRGLGLPYTYNTQGCALSSCCPSSHVYTEPFAWLSSYYSPGVCPSQYKSCPPYTGISSKSGETVAYCCPSNYQCPSPTLSDDVMVCQSGLKTSTSVTVLAGINDQSIVSTRPFTLDQGLTLSYVIAYPVQIRFRDSDLTTSGVNTIVNLAAVSTASISQNTGSSLANMGGLTSATTTASFPQANPTPSSGLSTGTKIGIGVGVALGVLLLALIAIGILICAKAGARRRRAAVGPGPHPGQYPQQGQYPTQPQIIQQQQQQFGMSQHQWQQPHSQQPMTQQPHQYPASGPLHDPQKHNTLSMATPGGIPELQPHQQQDDRDLYVAAHNTTQNSSPPDGSQTHHNAALTPPPGYSGTGQSLPPEAQSHAVNQPFEIRGTPGVRRHEMEQQL